MSDYELRRDNLNRVQADIADDVTVGIKVLAVTDQRRMEHGVHAYAVMDIRTSIGPIRIRDIQIRVSTRSGGFYLRWRQWPTGKMRRVEGGEDRKEYLDVAGPLDSETRREFGDRILEVFTQITEEAEAGTLGRANPELAELKARLVKEEKGEEAVSAETVEAFDQAADGASTEGETLAIGEAAPEA